MTERKRIRLESEAVEVPDWVADNLIEESLNEGYITRVVLYAKDGPLEYKVEMPYTIREL